VAYKSLSFLQYFCDKNYSINHRC